MQQILVAKLSVNVMRKSVIVAPWHGRYCGDWFGLAGSEEIIELFRGLLVIFLLSKGNLGDFTVLLLTSRKYTLTSLRQRYSPVLSCSRGAMTAIPPVPTISFNI